MGDFFVAKRIEGSFFILHLATSFVSTHSFYLRFISKLMICVDQNSKPFFDNFERLLETSL